MRTILALDQGTTSSRAIAFDLNGRVVALAQREFGQHFPQPGWVEHDAAEIWRTQLAVAQECIQKLTLAPVQPAEGAAEIVAIGIANQRETTVLWDRATGQPVAPAIVWQDRRASARCEQLRRAGHAAMIQRKAGLVLDAYFSATKLEWLLDNVPGARARAEAGELAFGTIDSWLIWNLTGGPQGGVHVTDASNASRTLLMNIHTLDWDDELLRLFSIPRALLPRIVPSSGVVAEASARLLGAHIPIAGIAGDQQAATFGQACFAPGMAKNTYGTGCFMLMNTGGTPVPSRNGLLTTIAWGVDGKVEYALEGAIFVAGAAVQWLRDELKLIDTAAQSAELAMAVPDSNGVYVVPAFVGLGAPYWDMYARGTIVGLTRGANRNHIVRATLESIAYQTRDVLEVMQEEAGLTLPHLKVDGGASANAMLLQFQADQLGVPVRRPIVAETTALGAAYLAGLAVGFWDGLDDVRRNWALDREFSPRMAADERARGYHGWRRAVERSRAWATEA